MDEDASWYGGMGIGPGDIVLNGYLAPLKGALHPHFSAMSVLANLNRWMDQDASWYGGRPRPRSHCVRWDPGSPERDKAAPSFRPCLLWPNGRPSQLLLSLAQLDPILYSGSPLPLKIASCHGGSGPNIRHGSLGPRDFESSTEMASGSVQLFLQSSLL